MKNFDINNIGDFLEIRECILNSRIPFTNDDHINLFRGQSKDSYVLKPVIARYVKSVIELKSLEKKLLNDYNIEFRNKKNHKKITHKEIWKNLIHMQHYGLPTRLLDWTIDPYVALFFAVQNNNSDVGQFWVYKASTLNCEVDRFYNINPFSSNLNLVINSSFSIDKFNLAEERRFYQNGKFTFQDFKKSLTPLEQQKEIKNKITKFTINPKSKEAIKKELEKRYITSKDLYIEFPKKIENTINSIRKKYNLV